MKIIKQLFGESINETNFSPSYSNEDFIPKALDENVFNFRYFRTNDNEDEYVLNSKVKFVEIISNLLLGEDRITQEKLIEDLRLHLLYLINDKEINVFGLNFTIDEIISEIKKINCYGTDYDFEKTKKTRKKKNNRVIQLFDFNSPKIAKKAKNVRKFLEHSNLNASDQFFPQMIKTKINGKSLFDLVNNAEEFKNNVKSILLDYNELSNLNKVNKVRKVNKSEIINLSNYLLQNLMVSYGYQPAFSLPATIAKTLYLQYIEKYFNYENDELMVLDTSCGWGSRLTGLLSCLSSPILSNKKVSYYCTDVYTETAGIFENIVNFWEYHINSKIKKDFKLYRSFKPAENLLDDEVFGKMRGRFDVALTSPPRFNQELYSNDKNQSSNLYKTYETWRINFLNKMIESNYLLLKDEGIFYLNIANFKPQKIRRAYPIEKDAISYAQKLGFQLIDTYYITNNIFPANNLIRNKNIKVGNYTKYEPIFVFKKLKK